MELLHLIVHVFLFDVDVLVMTLKREVTEAGQELSSDVVVDLLLYVELFLKLLHLSSFRKTKDVILHHLNSICSCVRLSLFDFIG